MLCIEGKWRNIDCNFTDQLFTSDGNFTVPCTGQYTVTAIGGGGSGGGHGSHEDGGGGGGSTAFYISGKSPAVLAGGGGGGAAAANGASGEFETKNLSLKKNDVYIIKIGKSGIPYYDFAPCSPADGYTRGYCRCRDTRLGNARGCAIYYTDSTDFSDNGGNGANFKNSGVHGGDYHVGRGGYGGYRSNGVGYSIAGKGTFGGGGNAGQSGLAGAVYIKATK
jgi:hypothetical protein